MKYPFKRYMVDYQYEDTPTDKCGSCGHVKTTVDTKYVTIETMVIGANSNEYFYQDDRGYIYCGDKCVFFKTKALAQAEADRMNEQDSWTTI